MAAARYATYGSAAYDYNRSREIYADVPAAEAPVRAPREKVRTRTKTRTFTLGKAAMAFGVFMALALVVLNLLSYAMLAEISESTTAAENNIIQLREEKAKLLVEYEQAFNMNEIEQYAINVMGMTRPSASQTVEVGSVKNDKAVVFTYETESDDGIISNITHFISSLLAYFK